MFKFSSQKNNGFIALLSIIIISTVLFVATLSIAQFGIAGRYFIMDLEQKTASDKLVAGCVAIVQIKIYNDANFNQDAPQLINLNEQTCTIESVSKNNLQSIVKVSAKNGLAISHGQITFDNNTADLLSWIEVSHF